MTALETETQREMIGFLAEQVVGPAGGVDEVLEDLPNRRYLMGTLYPRGASSDDGLMDEEADGPGGSYGEEIVDDPVQRANEWLPGSIGLSFYCSAGTALECDVAGARYEESKSERKRTWRRIELGGGDGSQPLRFEPPKAGQRETTSQICLDGRAELCATWRPLPGGYLVTVTLINAQDQPDPTTIDPELTLHQVRISCTALGGELLRYPTVQNLSRDPEEEELRLLYRHVSTYAVGHGCAADWDAGSDDGRVTSVWSVLIPVHSVPPVDPSGSMDAEILKLHRLMDEALEPNVLRDELTTFADGYESWARSLFEQGQDVEPSLQPARDRILGRIDDTIVRLRRSIEILTENPDGKILRAFRLANRAMLMQMRHSEVDLGGSRRAVGESVRPQIDYEDCQRYRWRPFQLAYLLIVLPGLADPNDPERDLVDLIWFPTGGGKTEAYLAVAAVEIILRRMRDPEAGAGTAVLTRYTLRLLTAQQFQRTATLACALEVIRRSGMENLGASEISIGLWVGESLTPNSFQKANELLAEMIEDPEPKNPFQLESCPWCGTEIVPSCKSESVKIGISASNTTFTFMCPNERCEFSDRLPIAVVDEELYLRPPTILIATVDKFARLAWVDGGKSFFGALGNNPPSLIIQDELHLLSGPLGTMVGIYEAAIDGVIKARGGRPKVLASTATIRRAGEQVNALFGRQVRLFPPSGIDSRDSYFAKENSERPGRTFAGVMSQSHTAATTMINVAAALLQAPEALHLSDPERDAYWTLIAYHNSLRELGRTMTQARDDIPKRLEAMATGDGIGRRLGDDEVIELTGNVDGQELTSLLERLGSPTSEEGAASFVATTNMLSVGVDVPRLGIMLVNGQPKTTAEYIQATSRVGRGGVPGIVVTMYSSTRPRDRSHYESYVPFHASLYRRVEPTSVTPFSLPARQRALHAALVILVRHGTEMGSNDAAGDFDPSDPRTAQLIDGLRSRAMAIDDRESGETGRHLDRLISEWSRQAAAAASSGRKLYYRESARQHSALLKDFGEGGDGWETMHSLRNVDRQCPISVIGEGRA